MDDSEKALVTSSNVNKGANCEENIQRKFDKSKIICYKCKKKGHFARECHSKAKTSKNQQNSHQGNYSAFSVLENNELTSNLDNELWILDSGATSHMTYRRDFFSDF